MTLRERWPGRRRWPRAVAGTAVVMVSVILGGTGAGAAGAGHGLSVGGDRSAAHAKSAAGTYELFTDGGDIGQLVLNADQTFQISLGESGVWVTTGKSLALSVTASPYADIGCTFSGTVGAKSLNSAKKPGNYICPGGGITPWYALRQTSV